MAKLSVVAAQEQFSAIGTNGHAMENTEDTIASKGGFIGEIDSFVGPAQPWMCDEFGHLNRRFYAAMFDDATLVVLRFLDVDDRRDSLGWADVRTETDFLTEVSIGTILKIRSSVKKIGRTSVTLQHVMTNAASGESAAMERCVSVRFNLDRRESSELGDPVIVRAQSMLVSSRVNRRRNGTPYRLAKGTPLSGCIGSAPVGPELSI